MSRSSYAASPRGGSLGSSATKMSSLSHPNAVGASVEQQVRKVAMLLKQQIIDTNRELDEKFTAQMTSHSDRLQQECSKSDERHHHLVELLAATDKKVAEVDKRLGQSLQDQHAHFSAVTAGLATHLATETDTLNKVVENEHAHFTEKCLALETSQTEALETLDRRLDGCVDALGKQLDAVSTELIDRGEKSDSHFNKLCAAIEQSVSDLRDDYERGLARSSLEQSKRSDEITQTVSEHYEHFTDVCYNLDRKLVAEDTRQDELIQDNHKWCIDLCNRIESKFSEETAEIRQAVVERHAELLIMHKELDGEVKRDHVHFTDECGKIQKLLLEKNTEQLLLLEQQKDHLTDMHLKLEQQTRATNQEQDKHQQEQRAHFTDICSSLDQNMSSLTAELNEKFTDACARLDAKFTESALLQSQRSDENYLHFTGITGDLDKKIDERTWQMEKQGRATQTVLESQLYEQTNQMDEKLHAQKAHSTGVTDRLAHSLTEVATRVDEKFTQRCNSLDERLEENHRFVETSVRTLDTKFTSELTDLDMRMATEHRQFSEVCVSLDRRITEDVSQLDEASRTERRLLERKLTFECEALAQSNASTHQHFTETCDRLAENIADASTSLDVKFTGKCTGIEESVSHDVATMNEQIAREHSVFTTVCMKIDTKISETQAALDDQIVSSCNEIAVQLQHTNDSVAELRGDMQRTVDTMNENLDTTKHDLHENVAASAERLERVLAAGLQAFGETVDTARQEAADIKQSCEESVKLLEDSTAMRVGELERHVNVTVEESLNIVGTKIEVMETRVKTEMLPMLHEAVEAAGRANNGVEENKDRIKLLDMTVKEDVTEGLNALDQKIEDMSQGMDIANILSALADAASA